MTHYPQVGEFLLATVKKIMPFGAFCTLEEYGNREAFLHISEVAPRWIKNIHEFIKDGQKLVAVVIRIDQQKDQVDISLKQVTERDKMNKLEEVRRENRAQGIFEAARKESKIGIEAFQAARLKLEQKFGGRHEALQAIVDETPGFDELGLPETFARALSDLANKNIKKPVFDVDTVVELTCYADNGIETVKGILSSIKGGNVRVIYEGAPHYRLKLSGTDAQMVEKEMDSVIATLAKEAEKAGCAFISKASKAG